jgi:hypothetical protein
VSLVSSSNVPAGNEETSKLGDAKVIEELSSVGNFGPKVADWQSAGQNAVTEKDAAANAGSTILRIFIERFSKPDSTNGKSGHKPASFWMQFAQKS